MEAWETGGKIFLNGRKVFGARCGLTVGGQDLKRGKVTILRNCLLIDLTILDKILTEELWNSLFQGGILSWQTDSCSMKHPITAREQSRRLHPKSKTEAFAGPLSDKLGRRISVLIGAASYVIFFIGIAFSPNIQVAYVAAVLGGIALGILGVLAIFAPILIGFTSTATFQLWLNCAQTFGKEIAGIPSASVSMMQTYYSAGTMVALVVTSLLITKFKQVRFLVIYPAISGVMLVLVYLVKTPMICFVGAFVIGYAAAGGVLQMATATENDLFPNIKGIITSLIMIASSLCNYTILSAAAKMSSMQVIMMNIVITVIGVLLAVFVNVGYGSLLAKTEQ